MIKTSKAIRISKGLELPISGAPKDRSSIQNLSELNSVKTLALVAADYPGMKPTLLVKEGDRVLRGQKLFEDKKNPGVFFTAPASGRVQTIHRGERRVFQSLVLSDLGQDSVSFQSFQEKPIENYLPAEVTALLQESGLWTALRTRPFSKTPSITAKPVALFINAMDTNPLAMNPEVLIEESETEFLAGVTVLSKLSPKTFVVTNVASKIKIDLPNVIEESFMGPHPAGNVGTHIHYLCPASADRVVWHLNYQDCIAIGKLFLTGKLDVTRVISLAGPVAKNPRFVRTFIGASLADLTSGEIQEGVQARIVSGSVFGGRKAEGAEAFLGRFHLQVVLLKEGLEREFLGWQSPGANKFSVKNVFVSKLLPKKLFDFTTNMNGSHRAIVPIGSYEAVMPGDFLPTQLLRFLMSKNTDRAVELGALELDEEDLALCTFVDPCKNDFGTVLRENLNLIEKEGV